VKELIIWIPRGDEGDATRHPAFLDATADYLLQCGALRERGDGRK
jgi:hypothetical protein